jgi:small basic protein
MVNGFFLNVLRVVTIAVLSVTVTVLWQLNAQVATLGERIANVLAHSDKRDEEFDRKMARIEEQLNKILPAR